MNEYGTKTCLQRSTYITSKNLLGSDCIPFHHLFRVLPHVFRILREAQFEELEELLVLFYNNYSDGAEVHVTCFHALSLNIPTKA